MKIAEIAALNWSEPVAIRHHGRIEKAYIIDWGYAKPWCDGHDGRRWVRTDHKSQLVAAMRDDRDKLASKRGWWYAEAVDARDVIDAWDDYAEDLQIAEQRASEYRARKSRIEEQFISLGCAHVKLPAALAGRVTMSVTDLLRIVDRLDHK